MRSRPAPPRAPAPPTLRACRAGTALRRVVPRGIARRGRGAARGRRAAGPARGRGLTLLEMLVVMVLVTLLGTLLLQGIGFFTGKYQVVKRARADLSLAGLQQHWFASSVRGLTPYGVEARRFVGNARGFQGITLAPLREEPGMPVTARWSIDADAGSTLFYAENGGQPLTVLPANGEDLVFDYADSAYRWHDRWPVEAAEGEWTPTFVRLRAADRGPVWLARVQANPAPLLTEETLR